MSTGRRQYHDMGWYVRERKQLQARRRIAESGVRAVDLGRRFRAEQAIMELDAQLAAVDGEIQRLRGR